MNNLTKALFGPSAWVKWIEEFDAMAKSSSYTKRGPGRVAKQGKASKPGTKAARIIARSGGG